MVDSDPTPTPESAVITLLPGKNNSIYYYEGLDPKAVKPPISATSGKSSSTRKPAPTPTGSKSSSNPQPTPPTATPSNSWTK
jgi:hypothetical protein